MRQKYTQGFTIVELIIVVVVIAILAVIVLSSVNGMQAKARDNERRTDLKAVSRFLELYYIDNGYYPPYLNAGAGMSVASWRATTFPTLSNDALIPPGTGVITLVNSTTPTTAEYGYGSNGSCVASKCTQFRLYWRSEVAGTVQTISSLN